MANKRTRDRQLAKLAARRQAERAVEIRRRNRIVAGVIGVVTAAVVATAGFLLLPNDSTKANDTPTPTPSASHTPKPKVACGAKVSKPPKGQQQSFKKPPPLSIDTNATYVATMQTSCGIITIELDAAAAPETVNSFVFLANQHYFDGTIFHRIDTSIDVIQGGDPTGTGSGGPGYTIPDEFTGKEVYSPGTLAMANANNPTQGTTDTGGSQFFIIYGPKGKALPPSYTIFGHLTSGLDVAKKISRIPVVDPNPSAGIAGQKPEQTVYIDSVTIKQK